MKRVLLDENIPVQLGTLLTDVACQSVRSLGLQGMSNGKLLRAAAGMYDVLITADRSMYAQQDLSRFAIALLVLPTNRKQGVLALAPHVDAALRTLRPGTVTFLAADGRMTEPAGR